MQLTLKSYIEGVESGKLNPEEVVMHYLKKSQDNNPKYNAYIRFHEDYVKNNIKKFESRALKAAPIGIKDIILTKGYVTSCGSKILEDFVSPYSASCFLNLEKNGGLMIGKTNMDEFAMGGSTENPTFGDAINNHGSNRTPGGSSGGSAVAVAADLCIAALGTDTGGSVRQPAAFCGIVGMKPTYGMVSRYGVQSMASSLDQVGVLSKTVEDAEILLKSIAGFDHHDSQSDKNSEQRTTNPAVASLSGAGNEQGKKEIKKFKIALPTDVLGEGLDPKIKKRFMETVEKLRAAGVQIDEVHMPILAYSVPIYHALMTAEGSTNLARFDGIRFGLQEDTMNSDSIVSYYEKIRSEGFGDEVKRRILLGTFVLSSANYEGYYLKAQQARQQMIHDMDKIFESYDIILTPTTPACAWKLGQKSDPLKIYLADLYAIPANMGGLPAMSVPMGTIEDEGEHMPVGIQIMAKKWQDAKVFELGKFIESLIS